MMRATGDTGRWKGDSCVRQRQRWEGYRQEPGGDMEGPSPGGFRGSTALPAP